MQIGFIGMGNMAQAMAKGILDAGLLQPQEILASAKTAKTVEAVQKSLGIQMSLDNREVAKADIVFLAVKPVMYETVIEEIRDVVTKEQIIVTIAPGKSLAWLKEKFEKDVHLIRTMPNTPALVGEGMLGYCCSDNVTQEEKDRASRLFAAFGKAEEIPESLMDVVVAVSGSSPAYVFIFIEAMADAAVAGGMPRAKAYQFAAQAVLGSAKMVLETGMHPGALKDMVCSPGGTTIEAVRVLEEKGMRSAVIEAMEACMDACK